MIYERTKTDFIWQLPDGSELHFSSKQFAEWIEALEKDAKRYRWLRIGERDGVDLDYQEGEELDAAIDAALTRTGQAAARPGTPGRSPPTT